VCALLKRHDYDMPLEQNMEVPERQRTEDVLGGTGMRSFAELLLPPFLLHALKQAGFQRPSPVQVSLPALCIGFAAAPQLCRLPSSGHHPW